MKELFDSLLKRKLVKVGFETLIKVSDSIFDCINFVGLQMSQNKSESRWIIYRFSWLNKNKKTTINPVKKWFQYTASVTLNHEENGKHLQRISKTKIYKYNWKGINYPSG